MSRFRSVGRTAFARGNSAWARNFNINLAEARFAHSWTFPASWRMLNAPMMSRMAMLCAGSEAPLATGFAEQFADSSSHNLCGEMAASEDAEISDDDVTNVATMDGQLATSCVTGKPTWSLDKEGEIRHM